MLVPLKLASTNNPPLRFFVLKSVPSNVHFRKSSTRSETAFAWPMVFPTYARSHRSGSWSMGGSRISALAEPGKPKPQERLNVTLKLAAASPDRARLGREYGAIWVWGGGGGRLQREIAEGDRKCQPMLVWMTLSRIADARLDDAFEDNKTRTMAANVMCDVPSAVLPNQTVPRTLSLLLLEARAVGRATVSRVAKMLAIVRNTRCCLK